MISRRLFINAMLASLLAMPSRGLPQQPATLPRIGVIVSGAPGHPFVDAFRRSLRKLGYIEGQNILIEWRYTKGQSDRATEFAAEFVRLPVDIIVAHFTPAVRAAIKATRTIPIVMAPAGAPLQTGFIASLAHPGGNVTGLSGMDAEIGGKRLQLLREIIPDLACVAVLASTVATDPYGRAFAQDLESAAATARIRLEPVFIDGPGDLENALTIMNKARAQVVITQPLFDQYRATLLDLAAKHHLPVMSSSRDVTAAGGLLSFSANYAALYERPADYVDKILKGAKPADLPVGQPTTFQIAINMKTARDYGLKIPVSLLVQVDEVIE